jgi:chromosome segregation ATPase
MYVGKSARHLLLSRGGEFCDNLLTISSGTSLADQVSVLKSQLELQEKVNESPPLAPSSSKGKSAEPATPPVDDAHTEQLKRSLAETLRMATSWEQRARAAQAENAKLKEKARENAAAIKTLTAEKKTLTINLKDRNEELRTKTKFGSDLQDELMTMNIQVAVAERERDKARKERQELIDRWVKEKAAQADKMNRANDLEAAALLEKTR